VRWSVLSDSPLAGSTLRLVRRDVLMGRGNRIAALTDTVALRCGSMHTWETVGIYDVQGRRIRRCWLVPIDLGSFDEIWS